MARARLFYTPLFLLWALFAGGVVAPCAAQAAEDRSDSVWEDGFRDALLTPADLSADRGAGGADYTAVSTQSLAATTTGNALSVAGNLVNGTIALGNDFGGAGFGSYVMNTGNNSTLTAATSVTIQMGSP